MPRGCARASGTLPGDPPHIPGSLLAPICVAGKGCVGNPMGTCCCLVWPQAVNLLSLLYRCICIWCSRHEKPAMSLMEKIYVR